MRSTFFVCDDVHVTLTGKLIMIGVYTADIIISEEGSSLGQLVFVFHVELEKDTKEKEFILEVTLPGEEKSLTMSAPIGVQPKLSRRRFSYYTIPFLVQNQKLQSGKIEAKVRLGKNEIFAGEKLVMTVPEAQDAFRSQKH